MQSSSSAGNGKRESVNRIELLHLAAACITEQNDERSALMRERIKAEVHEWPQDLIIETLIDAGQIATENQ